MLNPRTAVETVINGFARSLAESKNSLLTSSVTNKTAMMDRLIWCALLMHFCVSKGKHFYGDGSPLLSKLHRPGV